MSMQASATSAPARSGAPGWPRRPAGRRAPRGHRRRAWGSTRQRAERQGARHQRAVADGAAPQIRASERNVLEVAAAWSGDAVRAAGCRRRGRSRRGSACAGAVRRPRRVGSAAKCCRANRAAPSGSDQATSGASSAPPAISSDPPPMSKTAEPAGGPAEPPAYGEEGQPRLVLAREHRDRARRSGRRPRPARRRSCRRRAPPTSRTPSMSSQPLSSATRAPAR